MSYEMSVVFKGDYVEVRSSGEKSYQTAVILWRELTRVCEESNCYKVLGIAESTRPMPIMDVVSHQQLFKDFAVTRKYKVAWVELNKASVGNVKFLEMFVQNRGLVDGKLFDDVEEARRWLLEK